EGVAAKNITDITDPTPAPPRKGRVQEGMAAHKSFLQRVNCYIIAFFYGEARHEEAKFLNICQSTKWRTRLILRNLTAEPLIEYK
ncbi:MAG: hypothetical protein K6B13_10150, partial [Prevotella sp.]|nr:hypothetical protein [Prevotella sp.]